MAGPQEGGCCVTIQCGGASADARHPRSRVSRSTPFELTLLDLPSLPVSLVRQAGDLLRDRREPSRRHDQPQARLPLSDQRPWYRDLPAQIQDLLATPKAAPAGFTSRAADVPDIWQDYLPNPYSWANSLLVHLLALTAMLLPFALRSSMAPCLFPRKYSTSLRWCSPFPSSTVTR